MGMAQRPRRTELDKDFDPPTARNFDAAFVKLLWPLVTIIGREYVTCTEKIRNKLEI